MTDFQEHTTVGVVSDTHLPEEGPLPLQLLAALEKVDVIIHLGDFNDVQAYKEFQKIAPLIAVYGNLDSDEVRSLLPEKKRIEINGYNLGLIHGWGPRKNIEKRVANAFDNVDIILFGHSHIPYNGYHGDTLIFNPGSATCNMQGPGTYGILELGERITHKIIQLD
ncbi:MAG: YfcE family phosphodiesterase [bacterium]|nr:YfcE family phosphodiesterase [bacterium]